MKTEVYVHRTNAGNELMFTARVKFEAEGQNGFDMIIGSSFNEMEAVRMCQQFHESIVPERVLVRTVVGDVVSEHMLPVGDDE